MESSNSDGNKKVKEIETQTKQNITISDSEFNDFSDIESHIDTLSKLFYDDKCEDYLREIDVTEKRILNGEISFSSKCQELKDKEELMKYFKNVPVINQIYDDALLLQRCVELQKFVQGTNPNSEHKGIKTWFKYEGGK